MIGAPIYIAVDTGDSNKEIAVRLPAECGRELLKILGDGGLSDMTVL